MVNGSKTYLDCMHGQDTFLNTRFYQTSESTSEYILLFLKSFDTCAVLQS